MTAVAGLLPGTRDALPDDLSARPARAAAAAVLPRRLLQRRATDPSPDRRRAGGVLLALLGDPAATPHGQRGPGPRTCASRRASPRCRGR